MKKLLKWSNMLLCGLSTFTIFPSVNSGPVCSTDSKGIMNRASAITERAWKMTGKVLREALGRDSNEQENHFL